MTTPEDEFDRRDEPQAGRPAASPFRRLTPSGQPSWQQPPRPRPVDAFVPSTAPVVVPHVDAHQPAQPEKTSGGSRFRFAAVFGLLGGVFLLTAVAGGAYFAYQALLGHEDRVTAEYAPAGSWAYLAVNVDPTSHAWLDAWQLAKAAGIDDELSRLPKDGLAESGEDPAIWETLIKPAVGRELGLAVWPNDDGLDAQPNVAAIVMIADEAKANDAIKTLLDGEPTDVATYRDVTYQTGLDDSAIGIVDEALIVASTSEAFEEIVDARRDGALDDVGEFTTAAERAADEPLVFAYVNGGAIADAVAAIQDEFMAGPDVMTFMTPDLTSSLDMYGDLGQITLTVKADGNALRTEVLTEGRPDAYPTSSAGNAFTDRMPASTLFYVSSADLYGTFFEPAFDQYRTALDSGQVDGMMMPTPDDIEMMLGFDIEDDLLAQMTGPWAISVNAEQTMGEYGGQFHFFSQVANGATVSESLDTIVANFGLMVPVESIDDGYRFDIPEEQIMVDLTIRDDVLQLRGGYRAGAGTGSLADDPAFRAAMDGMPDDPTLSGYLATNRIWDLLPAEAWETSTPDARAALEAFGPLAFATAPDGDGTRTLFVITVGE